MTNKIKEKKIIKDREKDRKKNEEVTERASE
jgi:hypothetical protein